MLSNFNFSEPLYLDSKSMSFEASWILFTTFRTIMDASGVWRYPPSGPRDGYATRTTWAASVQDISGWRSWLRNALDPAARVIVDMGGGIPPGANLPFANPP